MSKQTAISSTGGARENTWSGNTAPANTRAKREDQRVHGYALLNGATGYMLSSLMVVLAIGVFVEADVLPLSAGAS